MGGGIGRNSHTLELEDLVRNPWIATDFFLSGKWNLPVESFPFFEHQWRGCPVVMPGFLRIPQGWVPVKIWRAWLLRSSFKAKASTPKPSQAKWCGITFTSYCQFVLIVFFLFISSSLDFQVLPDFLMHFYIHICSWISTRSHGFHAFRVTKPETLWGLVATTRMELYHLYIKIWNSRLPSCRSEVWIPACWQNRSGLEGGY